MDVYEVVNEKFISRNPIPPYAHSWGVFQKNRQKNYHKLYPLLFDRAFHKSISSRYKRYVWNLIKFFQSIKALEKRTRTNNDDPAGKVVARFYKCVPLCIFRPITSSLARKDLDSDTLKKEWFVSICCYLQQVGSLGPIAASPSIDLKDNQKSLLCLRDGGTSLPHKSYYDQSDTVSLLHTLINKYLPPILPSDTDDFHVVDRVIEFEKKVSQAACDPAQKNDPEYTYNKFTLCQLKIYMPSVPWEKVSRELLRGEQHEILIECPEYVAKVFQIVSDTPQKVLVAFFLWHIVLKFLAYFHDPDYEQLYRTHLQGLSAELPVELQRLEICIAYYGNVLCLLFQEKYYADFTKTTLEKEMVTKIVENIKSVLAERVQKRIKWMCPRTKGRFLHKLSRMGLKIGGEHWGRHSAQNLQDYFPPVQVDETDFFGNIQRLDRWSFETSMAQHRKETDRKEWYLNCFEVNAYYSPELNEIVFPWGILCPPFFSTKYSDIKNMARLGSIVGHEIIHGFDNHGSFFDHRGNLNQWWEPMDRERFQQKTKAVQNLYSRIVYRGIPVDGELTCPENIADLSGLRISFEALKKFISTSPLDKQKFFVYYAHTLCSYHSLEHHKLSSMLDTHSPASVRVNTCLALFDEFFKAFGADFLFPENTWQEFEIY